MNRNPAVEEASMKAAVVAAVVTLVVGPAATAFGWVNSAIVIPVLMTIVGVFVLTSMLASGQFV